MARGLGSGVCSSCFVKTKYTCLACLAHVCMRCSVFENDEDTQGWKAGTSVSYCEPCFNDKMERQNDTNACGQTETSHSHATASCSDSSGKDRDVKLLTEDAIERQGISGMAASDTDKEEEDSSEEEYPSRRKSKKGKVRKKPGRKTKWSSAALDDFIDIVVNNSCCQRKLILTNTKNQKNGDIYQKILTELKQRAFERDEEITFTVAQFQTKFKKCISECKQAALTLKTATGIKRFQEDRGFGKWFDALFAVVKTRDSCERNLALEPSSSEKSSKDHNDNSGESELFVPIKKGGRKRKNEERQHTTNEVLNLAKEVLENDPTKELIGFMKEEYQKSREHELKLIQLMLHSRANTDYHTHPPQQFLYHAMPQGSVPHTESLPVTQGCYQSWEGEVAPSLSQEARFPEGPLAAPYGIWMRSSTPNENLYEM